LGFGFGLLLIEMMSQAAARFDSARSVGVFRPFAAPGGSMIIARPRFAKNGARDQNIHDPIPNRNGNLDGRVRDSGGVFTTYALVQASSM